MSEAEVGHFLNISNIYFLNFDRIYYTICYYLLSYSYILTVYLNLSKFIQILPFHWFFISFYMCKLSNHLIFFFFFETTRAHARRANILVTVFSDSIDEEEDVNSWLLAPSWELIPADSPTIQPDPTL